MSVCFHPGFVPEFFNRSLAAASHIMPETEGMSDFMGRNKADQGSHQAVVKNHFAGTGIYSACLDHIPVVKKFHHIMVPSNIARQDFSGSWIRFIGTICIFNVRCKIPDY